MLPTQDSIFDAIKQRKIADVYRILKSSRTSLFVPGKFGPLHAASIAGNSEIVTLMCLNCPDLDCLDDREWSALCYAAAFENEEIVGVLLEFGADPGAAPAHHPMLMARALGNRAIEQLFDRFPPADPQRCVLPRTLPHQEFKEVVSGFPAFSPEKKLVRRASMTQKISTDEKEKIWKSVRRLSQKKPGKVPELPDALKRKRPSPDE